MRVGFAGLCRRRPRRRQCVRVLSVRELGCKFDVFFCFFVPASMGRRTDSGRCSSSFVLFYLLVRSERTLFVALDQLALLG